MLKYYSHIRPLLASNVSSALQSFYMETQWCWFLFCASGRSASDESSRFVVVFPNFPQGLASQVTYVQTVLPLLHDLSAMTVCNCVQSFFILHHAYQYKSGTNSGGLLDFTISPSCPTILYSKQWSPRLRHGLRTRCSRNHAVINICLF